MIKTRWEPDSAVDRFEGLLSVLIALRGKVDEVAYEMVYADVLKEFTKTTGWTLQDLDDEFYFRMTDCDHKNQ
tara:strand:+ start:1773 stop:1991 length:219 start_codon:yes stop_codon:yes gene_type:complete